MANEIIYSSLHTSLPVSAAVDIYLTRIELQPDPLLRQKKQSQISSRNLYFLLQFQAHLFYVGKFLLPSLRLYIFK